MSHTMKPDQAAEKTRNYYDNAKDSVMDARDYLSDKADEYTKNIQSQFNEKEEKLIQYTKSHPLKALGFAALLGYIASKIL